MNPDLSAIWQRVVAAKNSPQDAADPLTPSDIDAYIKSESKGKYGLKDITDTSLRNLGRSFVQGATMNFAPFLASGEASPETYDAAATAANTIQPGVGTLAEPVMKLIGKISGALGGTQQTGESIALKDKLFSEAHPTANFLANTAGMVGGGFLAPETAVEEGGAKVGAKMFTGATKAALPGTLSAAGNSPEGGGVAVPFSTAASAVLGAAIPGGAHALQFVTDPAMRADSYIGKILDDIGYSRLQSKLGQFTSGNRGSFVRLMDLDPRLTAAADDVANRNPLVNLAMDAATKAREQGKPARMLQDIRELFSKDPNAAPDPNAELPFAGARASYRPFVPGTGAIGDAESALKAWANGPEGYGGLPEQPANTTFTRPAGSPEYEAALAKHNALVRGLEDANVSLDSPAAQRIVGASRDALVALAPSGLTPSEEIFLKFLQKPDVNNVLAEATRAGLNGVPQSPAEAATTSKLIGMRSRLGDLAGSAFAAGKDKLGQSLKQAQQALTDHLVENLPGFSAVNAKFAAGMRGIESIEAGENAWTDPESRGIQKVMDNLSDADKQNYRYGMASELVQKLRGLNGPAMAAQLQTAAAGAKQGAESALQDKIKTIFGTQDAFDAMMKRADLEYTMSQARRATGNSSSVLRLNAQGVNPLQVGLQAASTNYASGAHLAQSAMARMAARMATRSVQRAEAEQAGNALMTRGTPAIDALLTRYQFRGNAPVNPGLLQQGASAVAPAVADRIIRSFSPQP